MLFSREQLMVDTGEEDKSWTNNLKEWTGYNISALVRYAAFRKRW